MSGAEIAAVIAAAVGPLGAYFVASRRLSGKIGTSEASELWKESGQIRDDYRQRISRSDERTVSLEARVAKLEHLNTDLARENYALRDRVAILERENEALKVQVGHLEQLLDTERKRGK